MTHDGSTIRGPSSRLSLAKQTVSVRDLAEAGAKGRALTPVEIKQVCEALRAQTHTVRNQFHSGT